MEKIYRLLFLFALSLTGVTSSLAQGNSNTIQGSIIDIETSEPLPGVNVVIKGTILGTVSDSKGKFSLSTKEFPVTLSFSVIGFRTQEVEVSEASEEELPIQLTAAQLLGEEIVVTASRVEESILKSPVAIEKLDLRALKDSPASNFYDALENVKGVQMTTSSITFK